MIKKMLIKWYGSSIGNEYNKDLGKFFLAADLLAWKNKKITLDSLKDQNVDLVIKKYYHKYALKLFTWWLIYGLKANGIKIMS